MGCSGSAATGPAGNAYSEDGSYSASVTRQWKVMPSQNQARSAYLTDGTMDANSTGGQLELRALFDYPIAHKILSKYYASLQMTKELLLLDCWFEIQAFKNIKFEKALAGAAVDIYRKYCTTIPKLDIEDVERCHMVLFRSEKPKDDAAGAVDATKYCVTDNPILTSMFDWLQLVCLERLHLSFVRFKQHEMYEQLTKILRRKYNNIKGSDFDYFEVLGEGGFGLVVHVRKKSTNKHYALKLQTKERVFELNYDHPWRADYEKQAFASCHHPFIIELFYAFQTKSLIMLVMSLGSGVDLAKVLKQARVLPYVRVRFYSAEIASALIYLHKKGMLYRDLKPGNVLLNEDGHITLVDLGAVADVHEKTLKGESSMVLEQPAQAPVFATNVDADAEEKDARSQTEQSRQKKRNGEKSSLISQQFTDGTFVHPKLGDVIDDDDIVLPPKGGGGDSSYATTAYSHNRADEKSAQHGNGAKRAMSILGTLGYMAPEIVIMLAQQPYERIGYTHAVDWWSLGVTMYKLLCGCYPFSDDIPAMNSEDSTGLQMSYNITRYAVLFDEVDYSYLEEQTDCVDFISRLLDVSETTRLGSGSKGGMHVRAHPIFKDIDWKMLEDKKLKPPYEPDFRTVNKDQKPKYEGLEQMIHSLGKSDWLQTNKPLKREVQRYFDSWDYASTGATLEEYEVYKAIKGGVDVGTEPRKPDAQIQSPGSQK